MEFCITVVVLNVLSFLVSISFFSFAAEGCCAQQDSDRRLDSREGMLCHALGFVK